MKNLNKFIIFSLFIYFTCSVKYANEAVLDLSDSLK